MEEKKLSAENQPTQEKQPEQNQTSPETKPTSKNSVKEDKPATKQKPDKTKEPLSKQSKEIMFGLLGGFSLVVAIVCFVLMFIF